MARHPGVSQFPAGGARNSSAWFRKAEAFPEPLCFPPHWPEVRHGTNSDAGEAEDASVLSWTPCLLLSTKSGFFYYGKGEGTFGGGGHEQSLPQGESAEFLQSP